MIEKLSGVGFLHMLRNCACVLFALAVILPWTLFLILRNIFKLADDAYSLCVDRIFPPEASK